MARPWESALHFDPTISCLTLPLVYPKDFAPGGRAVSCFDTPTSLALQIYPNLVVSVALVFLLYRNPVVVVTPALQLHPTPVAQLWLRDLLYLRCQLGVLLWLLLFSP